jgi:hypothetical protein
MKITRRSSRDFQRQIQIFELIRLRQVFNARQSRMNKTGGQQGCPGGRSDISRWCKPPDLCQQERKPRQGRGNHATPFHRPLRGSPDFSFISGGCHHRLYSLTPPALTTRCCLGCRALKRSAGASLRARRRRAKGAPSLQFSGRQRIAPAMTSVGFNAIGKGSRGIGSS